jgi:hypothetical protein
MDMSTEDIDVDADGEADAQMREMMGFDKFGMQKAGERIDLSHSAFLPRPIPSSCGMLQTFLLYQRKEKKKTAS